MSKTNRFTLKIFGCYFLVPNFDFCVNWVPESPVLACPPKSSKQSLPDLLPQFPGELEVTEKNGCDIWIQHSSITQERILWFLHFYYLRLVLSLSMTQARKFGISFNNLHFGAERFSMKKSKI